MRAFREPNGGFNYGYNYAIAQPYEICFNEHLKFSSQVQNFGSSTHIRSPFSISPATHFEYPNCRNRFTFLRMRSLPLPGMHPYHVQCGRKKMHRPVAPYQNSRKSHFHSSRVDYNGIKNNLFTDFSKISQDSNDDVTKSCKPDNTLSKQQSIQVCDAKKRANETNENLLSIVGNVSSLDDYADDDDNDDKVAAVDVTDKIDNNVDLKASFSSFVSANTDVVNVPVNSSFFETMLSTVPHSFPLPICTSLSVYSVSANEVRPILCESFSKSDVHTLDSQTYFDNMNRLQMTGALKQCIGNDDMNARTFHSSYAKENVDAQSSSIISSSEQALPCSFATSSGLDSLSCYPSSVQRNSSCLAGVASTASLTESSCTTINVSVAELGSRLPSTHDDSTAVADKPKITRDSTSDAERNTNMKNYIKSRLAAKITDTKCELCAVLFNSKTQRDQHIGGKKHLKRVKFYEEECESESNNSFADAANDAIQEKLNETPDGAGHNNNDDDDNDDVTMVEVDEHTAFFDSATFFYQACSLKSNDSSLLTQSAFEMFRLMEDYLRFLIRNYVSPGIDPTRMSWNELVSLLRRNTINKLSSALEKKLDLIRQLRNSVVHSCSLSADEQLLSKIFRVAEELLSWGRKFANNQCVTKFSFKKLPPQKT